MRLKRKYIPFSGRLLLFLVFDAVHPHHQITRPSLQLDVSLHPPARPPANVPLPPGGARYTAPYPAHALTLEVNTLSTERWDGPLYAEGVNGLLYGYLQQNNIIMDNENTDAN